MGPAPALMAVHFLYPSDIIGVIFHHHRGGSTTREADRIHPRVLAWSRASRPPGARLGDSQRLGMEFVPPWGRAWQRGAVTRWEEGKRWRVARESTRRGGGSWRSAG